MGEREIYGKRKLGREEWRGWVEGEGAQTGGGGGWTWLSVTRAS